MRRRAAAVALALLLAGLVSALAWPVYGPHAFLESLEILAPLGVLSTLLAELIAAHRPGIRGLRRQLLLVALLVALQLGAALALFAAVMFVSRMDAFFMALAAGYAVLVGLGAGRLVARRALGDLDVIRDALARVGAGERLLSIDVTGGDELAALAADVEAMVERLAAEERARRDVVAAVSHDLRTPLTNLRLIADGLRDGVFDPARAAEHVGLISTHVRTLSSLIDDLFELSRLEAGEIAWSMEQVALDQLVHETVEAMRPQAEAGRVRVRAEVDHRPLAARGNPEQLQRVLFNLLQNAIRHTPADGSVVVRATQRLGGTVEVEVADTGTGIDADLGARIFEPFVQGPQRVAGSNGAAGLGLAIARAIVAAHGGRIWLVPDGGGTRIRFTLPAPA